ncbi:MAG: flippase [Ruminococcaceae bacterium]|nr:flippase [Oscillospiraceae bacterium]
MIKKLLSKVKQFGKEGLFHIFGSSVLAKVGGIISSVVVIRKLPKTDYGSYVDAENLYAYFAIFIGLGIASAMIQYCSENVSEGRKNALYRYSLGMGMVGNFILLPLILGVAALKYLGGSTAEAAYLSMLGFLPFFAYADQYLQLVLRVKLKNKAFSRTNMIYTVTHVCGNIVLTLLFGVPGLILSQYLGHAVAALHSVFVLRKEKFFRGISAAEEKLARKDRREYISYSLVCAVTNFTSTALMLLDVTCLGLVLDDPTVLADYKVAATIPSALLFVPKSLMTFYYPKLVRAFSESKARGFKEVKGLIKVYALVNGGIFVCLTVFAPLIIRILYGEKYANVVPIFIILGANYLVCSFKNITGNTIAVLKKVKMNLLFAVLSGVLNIGLNLCLIPSLGSVGAAVATLCVSCCVVAMNTVYLILYAKKPEEPNANTL